MDEDGNGCLWRSGFRMGVTGIVSYEKSFLPDGIEFSSKNEIIQTFCKTQFETLNFQENRLPVARVRSGSLFVCHATSLIEISYVQ